MPAICLGIIQELGINSIFSTQAWPSTNNHIRGIQHMTKKKTPDMPFEKPVIYVHAKGHSPVSRAQIRSLSELGLPVLSRLQVDGAQSIPTIGVGGRYDQPEVTL